MAKAGFYTEHTSPNRSRHIIFNSYGQYGSHSAPISLNTSPIHSPSSSSRSSPVSNHLHHTQQMFGKERKSNLSFQPPPGFASDESSTFFSTVQSSHHSESEASTETYFSRLQERVEVLVSSVTDQNAAVHTQYDTRDSSTPVRQRDSNSVSPPASPTMATSSSSISTSSTASSVVQSTLVLPEDSSQPRILKKNASGSSTASGMSISTLDTADDTREHPNGEKPNRTLFVRQISSETPDDELMEAFARYGDVRRLYTKPKVRGFIMVSYFDKRDASRAAKAMQEENERGLTDMDVHFSIPKENASEKEKHHGVVCIQCPPNTSTKRVQQLCQAHGDVETISNEGKGLFFVEFFDIREADSAKQALHKSRLEGRKITAEHLWVRNQRLRQQDQQKRKNTPDRSGARTNRQTPTQPQQNRHSSPIQRIGQQQQQWSQSWPQQHQQQQTWPQQGQEMPSSTTGISSVFATNNPFAGSLAGIPLLSQPQIFRNERGDVYMVHQGEGNQPMMFQMTPVTATGAGIWSDSSPAASFTADDQFSSSGSGLFGTSTTVSTASSMSTSSSASSGDGNVNNNTQSSSSSKATTTSKADSASTTSSQKASFELDLMSIMRGIDSRTTLMIKNIPNKYTRAMLKEDIDEEFAGTYDFVYLPVDFKHNYNRGYAFINFINHETIVPFHGRFERSKWNRFNSEKKCHLTYGRIQGKQPLIDHFQNSNNALYADDESEFGPLIFYSSGDRKGQPQPFPFRIGSTNDDSVTTSSSEEKGDGT